MSNVFYVSNLDLGFELADLEALFTTVGDVRGFRTEEPLDPGNGRRLGVFEMETVQQAVDCVARFNGQIENGQRLSLSANKPKPHVRKAR